MCDDTSGQGECGTFPMQPADAESKQLEVGFEHGCSSAKTHLSLRFLHQPPSGVDGKPFPAASWEGSCFFLPEELALEVAGVKERPAPGLLDQAFSDRMCKDTSALEPTGPAEQAWAAIVLGAAPVTAQWFVVHDTGGGPAATIENPPGPKSGDRGVHLFVGAKSVYLNRDFSVAGSATLFEQTKYHPEFRGKMIHCEIENLSDEEGTPSKDPYSDFQYEKAALAYIFASYRAGTWLTVTAHIAVDLGIPGGHSDPRGFDFRRFYRIISAMTGMAASSTYGLLAEPTGKDYNDAAYLNTFPAQYEGLKKAKLKKAKAKKGGKGKDKGQSPPGRG